MVWKSQQWCLFTEVVQGRVRSVNIFSENTRNHIFSFLFFFSSPHRNLTALGKTKLQSNEFLSKEKKNNMKVVTVT